MIENDRFPEQLTSGIRIMFYDNSREELIMGVKSIIARNLYIVSGILLFVQAPIVGIINNNPVYSLICAALAIFLFCASYGAHTGSMQPTYTDDGYGGKRESGEIEVGCAFGLVAVLALVFAAIMSIPHIREDGLLMVIPFIPIWLAGIIGTLGLIVFTRAGRRYYAKQREMKRYRRY